MLKQMSCLQEAEEQMQQSFRERARLEKQKAKLEHELASWSSKLGVSIDLSRTESVEDSELSGSDKVCIFLDCLIGRTRHQTCKLLHQCCTLLKRSTCSGADALLNR